MIRPFKPTDIDSLLSIWLLGNLEAHSFIPESYWQSKIPHAKEAIPTLDTYVEEIDGAVVGFITLQDDLIGSLFVDTNHCSQGIGKRLLDHAKGIRENLSIFLYTKNERAWSFFDREGFVAVQNEPDLETNEYELMMIWPDATDPMLVDDYPESDF